MDINVLFFFEIPLIYAKTYDSGLFCESFDEYQCRGDSTCKTCTHARCRYLWASCGSPNPPKAFARRCAAFTAFASNLTGLLSPLCNGGRCSAASSCDGSSVYVVSIKGRR